MDNLCHTLAGAAFGEAGLKRRSRLGNATLMIAANIPDIDVLVLASSTPAVAFRRGWTHGLVAQAFLPVALTALMIAVARALPPRGADLPLRPGQLLLMAYVGVLSHVGLDLLNSYGLRILAPLDWRWFYGDTLFIIDPWLWLVLGSAVWFGRRRTHVAPARWGLAVAVLYIAVMVVGARAAREVVIDAWRRTYGRDPVAAMVGPAPVTPLERRVVVDAGPHYVTGTFQWLPPRVEFDPLVVPKNDSHPRVARARDAPHIRGFLVWSRFPFWTVEPAAEGTRVTVGDMRFVGRGGQFVQSVIVR